MYSDVVMEVNKSFFEKIIDELKEEKGIKYDTEMTVEDLKELGIDVVSTAHNHSLDTGYLGIESTATTEELENTSSLITVPKVKDLTVAEAKQILEQAGFVANVTITGDENAVLITNQTPKPGTSLVQGSIICLQTTESDVKNMVQVPNIKGMNISQATNELRAKNLNIKIDGGKGIVVSQDPTFETEVEEGTVINVVIKEQLKDGQ